MLFVNLKQELERFPVLSGRTIAFSFFRFPLPYLCHRVICAEPSTGVDPVSRRGMWAVIAGAKRRRAVALTTHSLEEADALCDRIGIMCNGAMQVRG